MAEESVLKQRAAGVHWAVAGIALLPFFAYFLLTPRLYALWAVGHQYERAVWLAVMLGAGYGVLAGVVIPVLLAWRRGGTRVAWLVGGVGLLLFGLLLGWQLLPGIEGMLKTAVGSPSGSTRYFNSLGSLYFSSYLTVASVCAGLVGLLLARTRT